MPRQVQQQQQVQQSTIDPMAQEMMGNKLGQYLGQNLNNYQGHAIFVDSDFLWECDILELFENYTSNNVAVSCVKHAYTNCNGKLKMDGQPQEWYPKKNWSSLMIFNCQHPNVVKNLTLTIYPLVSFL